MNSEQEKLFLDNMKLAPYVAHKYKKSALKKNIYFDDLLQECYVALCKAVKGFDPKLGNCFSTFAFYVIRNHIFSRVFKARRFDGNFAPLKTQHLTAQESFNDDRIFIDQIGKRLTNTSHLFTYTLLLNGATKVDTAKHLNVSNTTINNYVLKIREEILTLD